MQTLLGHHSAALTMDVYSDLWPTALEGIGERVAATRFYSDLWPTALEGIGERVAATRW